MVEDLPDSQVNADGSAVIRLLSYNVRSLRDDAGAVARVIRACRPDVVCVQEAPRFFRWRPKTRDLAARSAQLWIAGGRPAAGPALFTGLRARALRTEDVLLPRTPGLHQRGFAVAGLQVGGARFGVLSAHLSLNARERRAQADTLVDTVTGFPEGHGIAAGDINERPDGRGWRRLSADLTDAYAAAPWGEEHTSEAASPRQRIDGVFTTPGIEVLGCGVPVGLAGITNEELAAASDHRPVLAALLVPGSE